MRGKKTRSLSSAGTTLCAFAPAFLMPPRLLLIHLVFAGRNRFQASRTEQIRFRNIFRHAHFSRTGTGMPKKGAQTKQNLYETSGGTGAIKKTSAPHTLCFQTRAALKYTMPARIADKLVYTNSDGG